MSVSSRVVEILSDPQFIALEDQIAARCNTYVNRKHTKLIVPILADEVAIADISCDAVFRWILRESQRISDFVAMWQRSPIANDRSQEHAPDEPQEPDQFRPLDQGLGEGFLIAHGILSLLADNAGSRTLGEYLKAQRWPFAKKKEKEIRRIWTATKPAAR